MIAPAIALAVNAEELAVVVPAVVVVSVETPTVSYVGCNIYLVCCSIQPKTIVFLMFLILLIC